jgi:hypothetical protein
MQKLALLSVLLLAGLAHGLDFDVEAAKERPMAKVVTLLKDMAKQLEKEGEEDEEIYDKMSCWCVTNDREKTTAISDAEAHIEDLTTAIEEGTAGSARLTTEIKGAEGEVAENQEAVDKATAMRTKGLAEFNAEEKDALESISALKSAIIVLSKHHSSFLQTSTSSNADAQMAVLKQVEDGIQRVLQKNARVLDEMISPKQQRLLKSFVQGSSKGKKGSSKNAAPASGEIFGIMKQMLESFESNLSQSQKEEMESQKGYEDLKAAKEEEIAAGKDQIDKKTQELASTDEKLATNKEDLEDTTASLGADEKFLANLKEQCQSLDQEWEVRQKARQEEIEAVSKALAILTSDDAHDLFSKTLGFAQTKWDPNVYARDLAFTQMQAQSKRRTQAVLVLETAARKFKNPQLSVLANRVRLDAFTKVKKAIDDMVAELTKQKEDEIKHKDWCVEEHNTNERTTENQSRDRDDLNAKIADLESTLDSLTKSIATLKSEVAEMQVQLKRAGEDRQKEHMEFQTTVADQRATQDLIQSAVDVLAPIYDKKSKGVALAQAGQAPPGGFKEYKKAGGGGVMGMMKQIINDAKAMEAEAVRDEEDAQKGYEDFVKDTNKSIEEKNLEADNKAETKAKAEQDKVEAHKEFESVMTDLEMLANESADLHESCDFILKNFEIRQSARDQEMEALKQAKAILSGAKFEELLQTAA